MAASAKPQRRDLVAEAARRALAEAAGDVRTASRRLEAAVRTDRQLRDELTEPLLVGACYDACRMACRGQRKRSWAPPAPAAATPRATDLSQSASRVVHLASGTLTMFPLPGGRPLGEATRDEISAAAGFYETQAGDMATKARWLRLVAQSVPGERKAGEVLTERRLRELQEAARDA